MQEKPSEFGESVYNGMTVSMEEGTLAAMGLDPDKAAKLDDDFSKYRKDEEK
jgi:hypothetical protein